MRLTALLTQTYKHVFPFVKRNKMRSGEDLLIYCLLTDLEFVFLLFLHVINFTRDNMNSTCDNMNLTCDFEICNVKFL